MSSDVQNLHFDSPNTSINPTLSLPLPSFTLAPPITPSAQRNLLQPSTAIRFSASDPSASTPVKPVSRIASDNISAINRASPKWKAAEESIRSQMARTQGVTTPATVPKARAKTGGRRGRGGRRSTIKTEAQEPTTTQPIGSSSIGLTPDGVGRGKGKGRGRGGGRPRVRPIGGPGRGFKRKRLQSEEDAATKDDTDASETFTPLPTQSRSGRRIFKATNFTPIVIDLEAPSGAKSSPLTGNKGTADTERKVKKRYRKPGDASVCKNCGRGHSPIGNVIVFCDGCNTPWHQHCHDKPIGAEVVRIEEKEWFCADCTVSREERAHLEGNVSAEGMSIAEKRIYLQSLTASHLVSLLLHATSLHPNLPIFSPAQTSPTSAPPANPPAPALGTTANPITGNDDDIYELYSENDPLPYPKAGNGVPLPPESDDLAYLIDDDVVTFSHYWDWDKSGLFDVERMNGASDMDWGGTMVDVAG